MHDVSHDHAKWLRLATKIALRGHGRVEPNPMVGCVIVGSHGRCVGMGHHEEFGKAHAEVNALLQAGDEAKGATAYVTLEPCNHAGKTRPCTQALIDAQVARIIIAATDPNPNASGGVDVLRNASIEVIISKAIPLTKNSAWPFIHRTTTGLPFITAKWAQTIDGAIATAAGDSQWISNSHSRSMVHRERGKVDVILTGIGTVLADDPLLTARNVHIRRIARRVVIDPKLQLPLESKLLRTANEVPLTIVTTKGAKQASQEKLAIIESRGGEVWTIDTSSTGDISLRRVMQRLVNDHDAMHVLVEAGPGLLRRLSSESLINLAWVFIAPKLLGEDAAVRAITGRVAPSMNTCQNFKLISSRRCDDDLVLLYRPEDQP